VTGGTSSYSDTLTPLGGASHSTLSPNVTGTSLSLSVTNLYDVGINEISYSETYVGGAPAGGSKEIAFNSASSNPNATAVTNTNAYGSSPEVSVGYSPYVYNYSAGYGNLGSGTGDAIYSDNYSPNIYVMSFTAAPGFKVELNSFDLAQYSSGSNSVDVSISGGSSAYSDSFIPAAGTHSTLDPDVTGTTLYLTITNLYDVGLNEISYSWLPISSVPEPGAWVLTLIGIGGLGAALRTRRDLHRRRRVSLRFAG
jgi:hypothetical protein